MSKNNSPVKIYPSQLEEFKSKANELASEISSQLSLNKMSAFKRNDCLSIALGYKGHTDLVESAKFRSSSDTETPLLIFCFVENRKMIAKAFSQCIDRVSEEEIENICHMLSYGELRNIFPTISVEELKLIPSKIPNALISKMPTELRLPSKYVDLCRRIKKDHTVY